MAVAVAAAEATFLSLNARALPLHFDNRRGAHWNFLRSSGIIAGEETIVKYHIVYALCLFSLVACSRSAPRIPYGAMELVYYQGEGAAPPVERFSFFVMAEDDDGVENLETFSIYHDQEGLRWDLSFEDWVSLEDQGNTWIGSRAIAMPGNESLPRGQYRAVLVNKGGERTSRALSFDAPTEPRHAFPQFSIADGNYRVTSTYPEHFFICYDGEGNAVNTIPVESKEDSVEALRLPSGVRAIALWAKDAEYHSSALTDLVPLR
jgi:hypothetical protein